MTEKYELRLCNNGNYYLYYKGVLINNPYISFDKWNKEDVESIIGELNHLSNENEQLKEDNKILIRLLENQSIIIQKLHSKILEYQLKEPIVLTKEDLEIMGKAVSYYTHGRCPE